MDTMETPQWTLQERLTKAREFVGLDRFEMANRLGVTERTIRNWERGYTSPTRATVIAYSSVTGVPTSWLDPSSPDDPATQGQHDFRCTELSLIAA